MRGKLPLGGRSEWCDLWIINDITRGHNWRDDWMLGSTFFSKSPLELVRKKLLIVASRSIGIGRRTQ